MKKIIILIILMSVFNNVFSQKTKVYFTYGLNKVNYCRFDNFVITKDSILKNPDLIVLKNKNITFLNKPKNKIIIKSMLSFEWNFEHVFYINFEKISTDNKKENITFSNKAIQKFKNLNMVMKLTNEAFWLFYKKSNNTKHQEINKLKPLVQSLQGELNIDKLGEVLKENQSKLKQYLDN